MRLGKFTHANLASTIYADLDLLAFWYLSPANKATHLVMTGGAVVPVLESSEEVLKQKQSIISKGEKKKNGTKK